MGHSLLEVSKKSGVPIQVLQRWLRKGYISDVKRVPIRNYKSMGYAFTDEQLQQIMKVKKLRELGYSLGLAWTVVSRDSEELSELATDE